MRVDVVAGCDSAGRCGSPAGVTVPVDVVAGCDSAGRCGR